jgi:hypothetical protein
MPTTPNPLLLPRSASAAPLVIARLLIQHLPSPTPIGGRARTLPRQVRSTPRLSQRLLIMGLGMKVCIWVYWPIPLGKLAISWGIYRYIGVGRKYPTNAHNQKLIEVKSLDGHDGRLGAVRNPQLTEYSPNVVLDRAGTKEQLPGDLLVGAPVRYEP